MGLLCLLGITFLIGSRQRPVELTRPYPFSDTSTSTRSSSMTRSGSIELSSRVKSEDFGRTNSRDGASGTSRSGRGALMEVGEGPVTRDIENTRPSFTSGSSAGGETGVKGGTGVSGGGGEGPPSPGPGPRAVGPSQPSLRRIWRGGPGSDAHGQQVRYCTVCCMRYITVDELGENGV